MTRAVAIGARLIETASGKMIDSLDPAPDALDLNDIGHALANICRFQGHTSRHYSVAEHSIYVADLLSEQSCHPRAVLAGLMHDAAEAYMADLASPIKRDVFGDSFREAEDRLMAAISKRFGVAWPHPSAVGDADAVLLWCEANELLTSKGTTWGNYAAFGRKCIEDNPEVCMWIRYTRAGACFGGSVADQWIAYARRLMERDEEASDAVE